MPPAGPGPSGYAWAYPPPPAPTSRRGKLMAAGLVVAIVLATAALVVGGIALARSAKPAMSATPAASPAPTTTDSTAADHALCEAIAPLMAEDDRVSNAWTDTGEPGTPARDAALPKYRADTENWARRTQLVLDAHPDADPFFKRTLQRFIDDRKLLVANMAPGPPKQYDQEIWSDSLSAYGGPLSICSKLGIKW